MTAFVLEICVDTPTGLRAAAENGADRIELCAALSEGGLTPSLGLMAMAAELDVPCRAMIRPRSGDFSYTTDELSVMARDIDAAKAAGLAGVVVCVNRPDGALDVPALQTLIRQAKGHGLEVALHRGFDLTPDPMAALDAAIDLGVDTILTSGGAVSAHQGLTGLAALAARAQDRIEILAGSGVTAQNAADILTTGITAFHASCRQPLPARHDRVVQKAYDLGYVSDSLRDTDGGLVARLRHCLNSLESAHHVVC